LNDTKADTLIAAAGALPLEDVTSQARGIKDIIWVVEKTSRHMDWSDVPEGIGGKVEVSVWHELVQDHNSSTLAFPADSKPGNVVTVWRHGVASDKRDIVEFTQAVSFQISHPNAFCWHHSTQQMSLVR
jgi:hypothetical protein